MKLSAKRSMIAGPQAGITETLTGTVGQPMTLKLWASDAPPDGEKLENVSPHAAANRRPSPRTKSPSSTAACSVRRQLAVDEAAATSRDLPTLPRRGHSCVAGQGHDKPAARAAVHEGQSSNGGRSHGDSDVLGAWGVTCYARSRFEIEDGFDGLCCFSFANIKVVVK
jgi:hypothetical protein